MNASQIHLALTHLPVILSLVGMIALAISFKKNNLPVRNTALYILLFAGIAALPVFFTGEGAEEIVEDFPGVSESLIAKHEAYASIALTAILTAAVLALAGLVKFLPARFAKSIAVAVLIVSLISSGLLAQTAHLGGQIRHTEIRSGSMQQGENGVAGNNSEKDDD